MSVLSDWPQWAGGLAWTVATIGVAYGIGHLLRLIVGVRLGRVALRTAWRWDDALIVVVRRVPFWAVLAGAYLSLRHWPLSVDNRQTVVRIISALAVASVTFAAAALATRLVAPYGPRATPGVPVSGLAQNVARTLVIVLGVLVIIRSFGYDITPYLTALGVGGLAVALALQDPFSNFFCGVFMSVSGQIRIGDYLKLEAGAEGYVADFNWRATSIRMLANNIVIVPNAKLAQAIVTNFHQPSRELRVSIDVGVHYQSDLHASSTSPWRSRESDSGSSGRRGGIRAGVRFHTFGRAIGFSVSLRGHEFTDQFLLKHEFVKRLHARFASEGIVIPYNVTPLDVRLATPGDATRRTE